MKSRTYLPAFKRVTPGLMLMAGVSLVSACSSSSNSTPETQVPEGDDPNPQTQNPTIDPPTGSDVMFPADADGDDRPSLIVTGMNGMNPQDLVSPWLVNSGTFRLDSETPGSGDGYVNLVQYNDDFPVSAHIEFYEERLDTCDIRDPDVPQPIGGGNGGGGSPPPRISGGETVVINTPSGPWFTYELAPDDDGGVRYSTNNELPGALPQGATLSIPGDVFPTVAAHPLYEPEAAVRLLPDDEFWVEPDSAYTWIADSHPETYMKLNLLAYDLNVDFQGFYVTCYLEDDGQFTLPAAVVDYVASTEYLLDARYSRVYSRLDLTNGIVIYQENEVAE